MKRFFQFDGFWNTENGLDIFNDHNVGVNTNFGDLPDANLTVKHNTGQVDNVFETWNDSGSVESFISPNGSGSFYRMAIGNDDGSLIANEYYLNMLVAPPTSYADMAGVRANVSSANITSSTFFAGGYFFVGGNHTTGNSVVNMYGVRGLAWHQSEGDVNNLAGVYGEVKPGLNSEANQAIGVWGNYKSANTTTTIPSAIGAKGQIATGANTITTHARGLQGQLFSCRGTVTTASGLYIGEWGGTLDATVTNKHSIYIDSSPDLLSGTNNWTVRSLSTAKSELRGQLLVTGIATEIRTVTDATDDILEDDGIINVDLSLNSVQLTLPDPTTLDSTGYAREFYVKLVGVSGANTLQVDSYGVANVEFVANYPFNNVLGEGYGFYTNGTDWFIK